MVSGGERLTEPLRQALTGRLQTALIRDARVPIQLDQAALSETITERLHAQHAEDEQRILHDVREAALGSGLGAVGSQRWWARSTRVASLSCLVAVLDQQRGDLLVRLGQDPAHFIVDQAPGVR